MTAERHTLRLVASRRPVGNITRGTTNPNRLRRVDRWLVGPQGFRLRRAVGPPVVVDLGYGASPVTTVELHDRLRKLRADTRVVGIEIDPERVVAAKSLEREGLSFRRGGFEIPLEAGLRPTVVRAFNVLRQYDESEVAAAWQTVCDRLAPDGLLVDGTCDELGRRSSWVAVDRNGPLSLSLAMRLADLSRPSGLSRPSDIAERLPKILIHRNVIGEPVHADLAALDDAWARQAPHAAYGVRQRFMACAAAMREQGWPLLDGPSRWRLGEITVAWSAVAPLPQSARPGSFSDRGP